MSTAVRCLLAAGLAGSALAATPPEGFVDTVVGNASSSTAIAYEPGSGALFILEKGLVQARVRRKSTGAAATTALTLDCVDGNGERGGGVLQPVGPDRLPGARPQQPVRERPERPDPPGAGRKAKQHRAFLH